MSNILNIKNGQVTDPANAMKEQQSNQIGAKTAAEKAKGNTSFDKNMFLKLLAAEMQYQDPLEPTQNSEYVSEMATFSQVEATQNVAGAVDSISAGALIGKYVTVDSDDGTHTGIVDFTTKKDGKIFLNIDGKDYDADKVLSIKDSEYYESTLAAQTFSSLLAKLPDREKLTLQNENELKAINQLYESFSAYTRQFLTPADKAKLTELNKRFEELKANQG